MGEAVADREEEPDSPYVVLFDNYPSVQLRRREENGLLERVFEKSGKPRFIQWMFFIGWPIAERDAKDGLPSIMDWEGHKLRYVTSMLWHFLGPIAVTFGTAILADYFIGYSKN